MGERKWTYLEFGLIEGRGDLTADTRVLGSQVPEQGAQQSEAVAFRSQLGLACDNALTSRRVLSRNRESSVASLPPVQNVKFLCYFSGFGLFA